MKHIKSIILTAITSMIMVTIITACEFHLPKPDVLPQGNCPVQPAKEFNSYKFPDDKSKYVFILVDKSYEHTNDVLKYISDDVLPLIHAGDRITVAWMDLTGTTDSIFINERAEIVEIPQFPPTPIAPALVPTLVLSGPSTTQNEQMQENEKIEKENKRINAGHYCEIGKWNYESDKRFHQWENDQKNEINKFLQASREGIRLLTTKDFERGKLLYESLSLASRMINRTKQNQEFANYELVVFSDMYEWRLEPPDDIEIDFTDVKVAIAIHTCEFAIDCEIVTRWESEFDKFHAVDTKFIVEENNISKAVNKFISDIP